MADHKEFAKRLKTACDNAHFVPEYGKGQQTWFSERMGVSQEAVRKWFTGESRPTPTKMTRLAKLLNVDESWLALGTSLGMSDKDRKQYSRAVEAAAYMVFGVFMVAGYTCAFDDEDEVVDFHCIRAGKKLSVAVSTARPKSKNIFDAPVRSDGGITVNVCVVMSEPGSFDLLLLDNSSIERLGESMTDHVHLKLRKDKGVYRTDNHTWVPLKDTGLI